MENKKFGKCVFLGNYYSKEMIEKYSQYTSLSIGNDNYEKNFLLILNKLFDQVHVFCEPSVPRFSRKFPFLFIRKDSQIINNCETSFVSFLNGRLLNTRKCSLKKKLFGYIKANNVTHVFISTYHFTWVIRSLRKAFPSINIVMLLPDSPNVRVSNKSLFNNIYMKKVTRVFKKSVYSVNLLLPITRFQIDLIPNFNGEFFVYETFFDSRVFNHIDVKKEKKILYAGNLDKAYGIMDLIDSFTNSNLSEYELVICGKGDCEEQIKKIAHDNKQIKYLGFVSKKDVYLLEKRASLIVCPDKDERKYSFHSRYLEYLSSGTPILTYRPAGANEEYLQFFNYVEDYSNDFTIAMPHILNDNNYINALEKAKSAMIFMATEKNIDAFTKALSIKLVELSSKNTQ